MEGIPLYNVLGATTWVTAISLLTAVSLFGFLFANEFQTLLGFFEKASWTIGVVIFTIGYFLWRRKKRQVRQRLERRNAA